jgi:hypothetical protein
MTELEARRQLMADPRRLSPELRDAIEADPRLAALRDELLRTDAEMQRALTGAPFPEGLADRIVLRARYGTRSRWGLALAATVATLAIGVPSYLRMHDRELELARDHAIIEHVAEGANELRDDGRIEPAVFRASVAAIGVNVRDPGYRIRHLANCVIAGVESRHFVVQGPNGVVSYVILPGAKGDAPERELQEGTMRGLFVQRAGVTIGVFGQNGVERAELEKMMHAVFT